MEWFCAYREKEQAPLNMVFPKEGPVLWVDTLAIPKTSKNPDGAHKLINYFARCKSGGKIDFSDRFTLQLTLKRKKSFKRNH